MVEKFIRILTERVIAAPHSNLINYKLSTINNIPALRPCMSPTKTIRFTRQFDQMDCGPACIRMIASAYGKCYPLAYLRSLSHLTREGVSVAGIRQALSAIGMKICHSRPSQRTCGRSADRASAPSCRVLPTRTGNLTVQRHGFTGRQSMGEYLCGVLLRLGD